MSVVAEARARLGGTLMVCRSRARLCPEHWIEARAGPLLLVAWKRDPDGRERLRLRWDDGRLHDLDVQDATAHLPPGLAVAASTSDPAAGSVVLRLGRTLGRTPRRSSHTPEEANE